MGGLQLGFDQFREPPGPKSHFRAFSVSWFQKPLRQDAFKLDCPG